MAAPCPFSISRRKRNRLAKKLRKLLRRLERKSPDLVPILLVGRRVVVMDEADAVLLGRDSRLSG